MQYQEVTGGVGAPQGFAAAGGPRSIRRAPPPGPHLLPAVNSLTDML